MRRWRPAYVDSVERVELEQLRAVLEGRAVVELLDGVELVVHEDAVRVGVEADVVHPRVRVRVRVGVGVGVRVRVRVSVRVRVRVRVRVYQMNHGGMSSCTLKAPSHSMKKPYTPAPSAMPMM